MDVLKILVQKLFLEIFNRKKVTNILTNALKSNKAPVNPDL